jgi:plasmid maintenance system killer protein
MEVLFESSRLRDAAGSERERVRRFGVPAARKIQLRLQQLLAAETLEDMRSLPGHCHELTEDRAGCLAVDLAQPYRLVFRPTEQPPPERSTGGGLDWSRVDSITVIEIVDYH